MRYSPVFEKPKTIHQYSIKFASIRHYSSENTHCINEMNRSETDILNLDLIKENAKISEVICDEEALDNLNQCK